MSIVFEDIAIAVPRGSKILLVQLPSGLTQHQVDEIADRIRARTLGHWREHPDEPAVLVVTADITVRWLEAEAPEPATARRAPKQLPKQQRAMTTVTKGLGPARVRKT